MTRFPRTIGVVGGAGPMASAFLYTSLLRVCQQAYQAHDYADFPQILIVSYPFTRGDGGKIGQEIRACFSKLAGAGASLYCVVSHSFHGFLPRPLPPGFISIVEEGLREAKRLKLCRALVVAAETTVRLRLYEQPSIESVYPEEGDQGEINRIIREVAGGKVTGDQSDMMSNMIAKAQRERAIDGVLIACTELPLVQSAFPLSVEGLPVVDTMQTLARALITYASKSETL